MPPHFERSGNVECLTFGADVFATAPRSSRDPIAQANPSVARKFSLLLAEDDDDDAFLVEWAVKKVERFEFAGRARDGEEVVRNLQTLHASAQGLQRQYPDVLVLDLKMPRGDGFAVLEWLKNRRMQGLVVAVLTGSLQKEDMVRALQLGAQFYQLKTPNTPDYIALLRRLELLLNRRPLR